MAILSTGNTFGASDTVTNTKLNNIANAATFDDPVDDSTLELHTDGKLRIKAGGVTVNELNIDAIYPVGSIYMNASDSTNPSTLLGFGTWVAFGAGRVPVGIDSSDTDFDTAEETGGAKTHTLTKQEIPPHTHSYNMKQNITGGTTDGGDSYNLGFTSYQTGSGNIGENSDGTGNASPHNNLQPYIVVYMWKRTA